MKLDSLGRNTAAWYGLTWQTVGPLPVIIPKVVNVRTLGLVDTVRAELVAAIWSGGGLPGEGVTSREEDVASPFELPAALVARTDRLTIDMRDNDGAFVMANQPFLWHPESPNGRLVVYHYGHSSDVWDVAGQKEYVLALLAEGYTVAGVQMPLGGVAGHNAFPAPTPELNYLRFFLEPTVRLLNELGGDYDASFAAGFSGGGWATSVVAAIDPRVTRSAQVAGGIPLYMSFVDSSRDWEQFLPGVRDLPTPAFLLDYQDLYVMACDRGRAQLQVNIHGDHRGGFDRADTFVRDVMQVAEALGGEYRHLWDPQQPHTFSELSRGAALAFLAATLP